MFWWGVFLGLAIMVLKHWNEFVELYKSGQRPTKSCEPNDLPLSQSEWIKIAYGY